MSDDSFGYPAFSGFAPPERLGFVFICEVPKELGQVTALEAKRGRVIARTESGTTMIVPCAARTTDPEPTAA